MDEPKQIFESDLLARRRDRAMTLGYAGGADFLTREVAAQIAARLAEIRRDFPRIALVGTGAGAVAEAIRPGGEDLVQLDPSPAMAAAAAKAAPSATTRTLEHETLDLGEAQFDLALSVLTLHHVNDPIGQLVQLRRALKPDGLMIAALFGGQTLAELRASLAEAEVEVTGGLSPRITPMGEIRDLGGLITRAGLAMPVADAERLTVTYETPLHLMRELRAMGESNVLADRRRVPLRRAVLERAIELYAANFAEEDGRIRASFEIVFLSGWAPGPDQPRALRPGSAKQRLADALGTSEVRTGIRADP